LEITAAWTKNSAWLSPKTNTNCFELNTLFTKLSFRLQGGSRKTHPVSNAAIMKLECSKSCSRRSKNLFEELTTRVLSSSTVLTIIQVGLCFRALSPHSLFKDPIKDKELARPLNATIFRYKDSGSYLC
jgi:hypothetical protein